MGNKGHYSKLRIIKEWNIGRMEYWKNGILEEWNIGRME